MSIQQLEELLKREGLKIDGYHQGAGHFRDLEIGVGADTHALGRLKEDLQFAGVTCKFQHVTNKEHPDHGKMYLEVPSFWWE